MKLSEVLNRDQRSERFSGKRKRKESPEIIGDPAGGQTAVSSLMKQPRRSVIQARSELFPVEESNLNESDEHTQLHINGPKVDKTLMKRAKSGGDIFTDVCMLGMVRDEEKELIIKYAELNEKNKETKEKKRAKKIKEKTKKQQIKEKKRKQGAYSTREYKTG